MAIGDIVVFQGGNTQGSRQYNVQTSATLINAGEPVSMTLGSTVVFPTATSTPVVGTDYIVGIAQTTSTNTATVVGIVNVLPNMPSVVYLIKPKTATSWDTQAEYDALVGKRMTLDLTSGSYTINATDAATNGCVIMPLNVAQYPGMVAFSFRNGVSNLV